MTPVTASATQLQTIAAPELQTRDREFIRELITTGVSPKNSREERQAFFEKMFKIASTGPDIFDKAAEVAVTVYMASKALAHDTARLIDSHQTNSKEWQQLRRAWQSLQVFNDYFDKFSAAIEAGIATEPGLRDNLNSSKLPAGLKQLLAN